MNESGYGPFWMVWNPQGHKPFVRHYTRDSAVNEAKRLARENPGEQFYILVGVARYEVEEAPVAEFFLCELPF